MYRSPIEILTTDIQTQIDKGLEEEVFKAVVSVGINVDKEELIRVLQYDRNQYSKGYADGKAAAMNSIIRCMDCSHYAHLCSSDPDKGYCGVVHLYVKPNEFCSHGERREEK